MLEGEHVVAVYSSRIGAPRSLIVTDEAVNRPAVRALDRQLSAQKESNARLKTRNDALDADVRDLKSGFEAIEERARAELGMVKQDEVFFQLQQPSRAADAAAPANSGMPASLPIRPASSSREKH